MNFTLSEDEIKLPCDGSQDPPCPLECEMSDCDTCLVYHTKQAQKQHTLKEVSEQGAEECAECADNGFHHLRQECPKFWLALRKEAGL